MVSKRANRARAAAVIAASAFATVGVVVGVVGVTRPGLATTAAVSQSPSLGAPQPTDSTAGGKALCSAMKPLFAEMDAKSNAWIATGNAGTPARDAALPGYRAFIEDWAGRAQDIVNANAAVDPFLVRTTQRFVDDRVLLVRNMRPGPSTTYDKYAWADSMTAYGGPLSACDGFGITW
uniref:hypothetical protein n=1 Tax=Mycolicibacterium sp. CBMA 213 TaxID=1968788 RepID=UPI00155D91C4|nr:MULTISPECIES: hypothetical protein [unclassified Mycolicibacterium]